MDTPADPAMESVLKRYLEIQRQELALRDEKARLQTALADYLETRRLSQWLTEAGGQKLKVKCVKTVVVEYDEEALRLRLGDRYAWILAPDPKKIRQHLGEIGDALTPVLHLVGSPSAERVRSAIERATVTADEFKGAFRKSARRIVSVSRFRPEESAPPAGEEADA